MYKGVAVFEKSKNKEGWNNISIELSPLLLYPSEVSSFMFETSAWCKVNFVHKMSPLNNEIINCTILTISLLEEIFI